MQSLKNPILSFSEFIRGFVTEQDSGSSDPPTRMEQYRMIAVLTRQAFDLYRQFFVLINKEEAAREKGQREWTAGLQAIRSERGMENKWKKIVETGKQFQRKVDEFSKEKSEEVMTERPFHFMELDFTGDDSENLIFALEKLQVASKLSTKGMANDRLRRRLEILDQSLNPSFKLKESLDLATDPDDQQLFKIWEGQGQPAPAYALLFNFIDQLEGQVLNLKGSLRNIEAVLPEADRPSFQSELNVVQPLVQKTQDLKSRVQAAADKKDPSGKKDTSGKPLPRSVKKGYATRNWQIETEEEKNRADLYDEMMGIQKEIQNVYKKIGDFRTKAADKYILKNDAQDYISRAAELINEVDRILVRKLEQAQAKKLGGQIIRGSDPDASRAENSGSVGASDQKKSGSAGKGGDKAQELGQFLKKRFGL